MTASMPSCRSRQLVDTDYTQSALEAGIKEGSFMLHRVDDDVCVLTDINSFVSFTDEKSEDFASNQTVRVLDQIANDIAVLFGKKYVGKMPELPLAATRRRMAGRVSLWNDIVTHHRQLESVRAIEDFDPQNVTVAPGETKKSVVVTSRVTPVNGGDAPAGKVKVCSRAAVSFRLIKHPPSRKVTNS